MLDGKTIAFLVAPEGAELVELTEPWKAVKQEGGAPRLVSTAGGQVQAFNHLDRADMFAVDDTVDDIDASSFDGLVMPGGVANADYLRTVPRAVEFARDFFDAGKPVAVICHASWTLIEADVLRGRTITSWPSLQTDLRNAGAHWVDKELVVDTDGPNIMVSSRMPDDLRAFCQAITDIFST